MAKKTQKTSADELINRAQDRPDLLEKNRLKNELSAERRKSAELIDQLQLMRAQNDLFASLDACSVSKPIVRREKKSGLREATAFIICSDWHVGETVNPRMVNGHNEFNPKIAKHRVAKLAQGAAWLIDAHRDGKGETSGKRFVIRDVVLSLVGDMITGWLHQDQRTTNSMLPTPEVLEAYDLIRGLIDYILEHVQPETLTITGNYGNHARLTMKTLNNAQAETSLEWLIYQFLVRTYANEPRVRFDLCAGKLLRLQVYDTTVRLSHGDDVGYGGGIGGVTIPINKAIRAWNTLWHADVDVMGHWHQYVCLPNLVINSSLIGYSPYSIRIKAPYEPPTQSFFLIEPGRGKRADNRIWLESTRTPA